MNAFLETFFKQKPSDFYALIWVKQGNWKRSYFVKTLEQAEKYIVHHQDKDIYIGCGWSKLNYGEYNRCKSEQIIGIPAVWIDLDVLSMESVHSKPNLFPSKAEAIDWIKKVLPPTFIVDSGHGIHGWWFLKEPWIFKEGENSQAAHFLKQWISWLQSQTVYELDAVHDLARVMRLPGTINYKDEPIKAEIIESSFQIYNLEDLKFKVNNIENNYEFNRNSLYTGCSSKKRPGTCLNVKTSNNSHSNANKGTLRKIEILCANDSKFQQVWKRTKPLQQGEDSSPSGWDYKLICKLVSFDWNDTDIAQAIEIYRHQHNDDNKKASRLDYIPRSIQKARKFFLENKAIIEIEDTKDDSIEKKREKLSEILGIEIKKVVKYLTSPFQYSIFASNGEIHMGGIGIIMNQTSFINVIADLEKKVLKRRKGFQWDMIAQLILDCAETVDLSQEATEKGYYRNIVEEYIDNTLILDSLQLAAQDKEKHPFKKDGNVCIFLSSLQKWLLIHRQERPATSLLCRVLRGIGYQPKTYQVKREKKNKKINFWEKENNE